MQRNRCLGGTVNINCDVPAELHLPEHTTTAKLLTPPLETQSDLSKGSSDTFLLLLNVAVQWPSQTATEGRHKAFQLASLDTGSLSNLSFMLGKKIVKQAEHRYIQVQDPLGPSCSSVRGAF